MSKSAQSGGETLHYGLRLTSDVHVLNDYHVSVHSASI